MNNVLALPPCVRGKVSGFLKLFVEEIQITKKIFHLNNGSSLVAQVQWWGETLPIFLRPEKLCFVNQNGNQQFMNSLQEFATYEIRTNFDLFRSYLKSCESLEIVVHEETKNIVVGSAFFHNLHQIVGNNKGSSDVVLPLVDYQGDIIGELKLHLNLSKDFLIQEVSNPTDATEHITSQCKFSGNVSDGKHLSAPHNYQNKPKAHIQKICSMVVDIRQSDRKFNYIKTGSKILSSYQNNQKQITECHNSTKDKKKTINSSCENHQTCQFDGDGECSTKQQLPQIQTEDDFSKVISIVTQNKAPQKTNVSMKKPLPRNSHRKVNLKKPVHPPKTVPLSVAKTKTTKPMHEFRSKINMKENKFQMKESDNNRSKQNDSSISSVIFNEEDTKGAPVEESSPSAHAKYNSPEMATMSTHVIDYLFGCEMSKEDEEKALSSLMNMSPCHHLVKNITKLYSNSPVRLPLPRGTFVFYDNRQWPKCKICKRTHSNYEAYSELPHRQLMNNLNYNFNNPVERKYYAKFFGNHENSYEFQIAQILNKPERDLDRDETVHIEISECKNETDQNINLCHREPTDSESIIELKDENANDDMDHQKENESINGCCQYYKKLNELDKIIESLNGYEKKILTKEKLPNAINTS